MCIFRSAIWCLFPACVQNVMVFSSSLLFYLLLNVFVKIYLNIMYRLVEIWFRTDLETGVESVKTLCEIHFQAFSILFLWHFDNNCLCVLCLKIVIRVSSDMKVGRWWHNFILKQNDLWKMWFDWIKFRHE